MDIGVKGKHNPVSEELKQFAAAKLEHLGKFLSTLTRIEVEIYRDGRPRSGGGHVADVIAATAGPVFRARAVSPDPRRSIDIAYERLKRQVKEFKRRRSAPSGTLKAEGRICRYGQTGPDGRGRGGLAGRARYNRSTGAVHPGSRVRTREG